jgi:transposase InsO family protein
MYAFEELTAAGTTQRCAARLTGMSRATMARRRTTESAADESVAGRGRVEPVNKLGTAERAEVLAVLNSDRFIDATPTQVYATLLAEGRYLCSISTMYRILGENTQVKERRRLATHRSPAIPELVAAAPRQVYTWDITKLAGPQRGVYYDAYVMIDIYSRYIVGVHVHTRESGPLAVEMMREVFGVHGIPHVVHADRGTSMTSKTVTELLADLNVTKSHSRPHVSNDNPYSESWFKTMKYAPAFPARFGSIQHAREFLAAFEDWYNHDHHHSGIGLHTPADVHYGHAPTVAAQRSRTLAAARRIHPERFGRTDPAPKILDMPGAAWINKPEHDDHQPPKPAAA